MALRTCPICEGTDLDGVEKLADGRLVVRCLDCDHEWIRGEAQRASPAPVPATFEGLKAKFPTASDVSPDDAARVEKLIARFLELTPTSEAQNAPYREKYQRI